MSIRIESEKSRPPRAGWRWTALVSNILLVIGSIFVAFLLAELALRAAGIGSDQFLRPDPVLGVRFIPSKTGLSQDSCYRADVSINAQGWRSREIPVVKPRDVYRVLVLGDSFMAGMQVNDDEVFASVLERSLSSAGLPRRVEVINFGVPSYGTDQEYLSLREFGLVYEPDLVLLAFYGQNDATDNFKLLISAKSVYPKPFFDVEHNELMELPFAGGTPWPIRIVQGLAAHSRLYPLVRDAAIRYPPALGLLYRLGIVGIVPQDGRPSAKDPTAAPWPWPDRWRRQVGVYERDDNWVHRVHAWEITERLLKQVKQRSEQSGAAFLVVELSSPISVMPPSVLGGMALGPAIDADRPSILLAQIAHRQNLDLVSLVPGFRHRIGDSEAQFAKYYLNCDGHWTVAGHRLAAEIVAPEVAARIARTRP